MEARHTYKKYQVLRQANMEASCISRQTRNIRFHERLIWMLAASPDKHIRNIRFHERLAVSPDKHKKYQVPREANMKASCVSRQT